MSLQLISPDGVELDLAPGSKIQLNLVNSAFDSDILKGSFSYSLSLPLTAKNIGFFKNPDNVASTGLFITNYPGFKLKDGLIEFICKVVVQDISKSININIFTSSGVVSEILKTTKLNQLPIQTILTIDTFNGYNDVDVYLANYTEPVGDYLKITLATTAGPIDHGTFHSFSREVTIRNLIQRINRKELILPDDYSDSTGYVGAISWVKYLGNLYYNLVDTVGINPVAGLGVQWQLIGPVANYETLRSAGNVLGWYIYDSASDPKNYTLAPYMGIGFISLLPVTSTSFQKYLDINRPPKYAAAMLHYMHSVAYQDIGVGNFQFYPIHDKVFLDDTGNFKCINYWKFGGFAAEQATKYYFDDNVIETGCVPQPRLSWLLKLVHEFMGYEIDDENVFSNQFLHNLFAYNNYGIEYYYNKKNYFGPLLNLQKCVPDLTFVELINGFRSYFFLGCFFDNFSNTVKWKPLKDILTDYENAIDLTSLVSGFKTIKFNNPDGFLLYYSHDSSDKVTSEINDIYSDNLVIIPPVANVAALPAFGNEDQVCFVESENAHYISTLSGTTSAITWSFFASNFQGIKIGNGTFQINPKCSTMPDYTGTDYFDQPFAEIPEYDPAKRYFAGDYFVQSGIVKRQNYNLEPMSGTLPAWTFSSHTAQNWRVPMSGKSRKSRYYNKRDTCSLRVLSYAGVRQNPLPSVTGDRYPIATSNLYSVTGVLWPDQPGGSCLITGQYGTYEQFGKQWIDFLAKAKKVEISIKMDAILLAKLKPWIQIKIGNTYYLWESMKPRLPLDSGLTDLTLYSIEI